MSESTYDYEVKEIKVFEVKETVPAKNGKKAGTRSLGFARDEEHAKVILKGLPHGGKTSERDALLTKKKDEPDTAAKMSLKTKTIYCIYHIDNADKIPLEHYRTFSKDQQRYLTLIGEAGGEDEPDEEE